MAPRRKNATAQKENLVSWNDILNDFGIQFVGPLPPRKWPEPYRHHFEKVREIGRSLFDGYEARSSMPKKNVYDQIHKVDEICREARELRQSTSYNEATWRDLVESIVMERFKRPVNCARCGYEQYEADFWADSVYEDEMRKLATKRLKREHCQCHRSEMISKNKRNEEQNTALFRTVVQEKVYHHPEDEMPSIPHIRISMEPDRAIGIRLQEKYERLIANSTLDLTHHPGAIPNIIYPFCVLEAKKEHKAPGFRAVEAQTAFPIRRFLLMQRALRDASGGVLDPLVWFLANQGDIWRLYAAIPVENKMSVFDLWLGSIESEDGALQLLQITDYIWTWARDIYRHQIRRCLKGANTRTREESTTTTVVASRTASVLSDRVGRHSSFPYPPPFERTSTNRSLDPINGQFTFRKAALEPLSSWADDLVEEMAGNSQCIVRHADRVTFVCSILSLDSLHTSMDTDEWMQPADRSMVLETLSQLYESRCVFQLTLGQLLGIKEHWLGRMTLDSDGSPELLDACLLVRNQCTRSNWQVSRTLHCLVVPSQSPRGPNATDRTSDLLPMILTALDQLRSVSGRFSVMSALQPIPLVLQASTRSVGDDLGTLTWMPLLNENILQNKVVELLEHFERGRDTGSSSTRGHLEQQTLEIFRHGSHDSPPTPLPYNIDEIHSDQNEAILTLKPRTWPEQCPIFCVFIFRPIRDEQGQFESLRELVRQTIQAKKMHGIDKKDNRFVRPKAELKQLLTRWEMAYSQYSYM